jgi:hypothetical protein
MREMKNTMLLVFATKILASTNLRYRGYAFLERYNLLIPDGYKIKLK